MDKTQSFTKVVKEELCTNEYENIERVKALLSAYIRINGTIVFTNHQSVIRLKTENAKIAKFIYLTINSLYKGASKTDYLSKGNTKKTQYCIVIDKNVEQILEELEISFLEGKISKNIVYNDDTISGYLIGAFLASGSINSPRTSNYHLELCVSSENYAKWLAKLFAKFKNSNIEPKVTMRRDKYVIYFKKSDQIANFLIMIGAVSSCMEFENIRVDRDFTNSTNRLNNSDLANLKKSYETGQRQKAEITVIDERLGLKNLPNIKERELAYLRMENEAASLLELASLLSEKLDCNITKSNVNHLFRSLHEKYLRLSK
jgi:DNA-binding protein WhiA